jgi:hypothetical protein
MRKNLQQHLHGTVHLNQTMLAGNPRIGRGIIFIVILVLVILLATLAELRNKPDPEKQLPIHPSTLIASGDGHIKLADIGR